MRRGSIEKAAEALVFRGTARGYDPRLLGGAGDPSARGTAGEHFLDGGIVNSIPIGRAVELETPKIYVLHVGRIEQPLTAPKNPWQVGMVVFELSAPTSLRS